MYEHTPDAAMKPRGLHCREAIIPERDRRCIFEDIFVGDDLGAAMAAGFMDEAADCVDISTVIWLGF